MLQNLNQIRARHALEFAKEHEVFDPKEHKNVTKIVGENGGEVIKKIPPVVMNNGLLAALAFAMDEKQKAWKKVFDGIATHLASREIGVVPTDKNTAERLLDHLVSGETSSDKLREATDEAMLWLEYARRFV